MNVIDEQTILEASDCLKCISHPNRLKIINLLEDQECTVNEIVDYLKIPQSVTSDHLRLMQNKGILKSTRKGRYVYYALAIPALLNILECIRNKNLEK